MDLTRRLFLGRTGTAAVVAVAAQPAPRPARADGPLLADDVTGTNAYELYAAGDPNWRANTRKTGARS